jgi:hypothetical protein
MHNHFCWSVTAGFRSRPISEDVDFRIATLRHYRKRCSLEADVCKAMARNATWDDSMVKYASQLERLVYVKMHAKDLSFLLGTTS